MKITVKFLSTPSARRATCYVMVGLTDVQKFLSTPSARRATDHLASTPAGALEVLAGEVLAQGRCVAGLIDDDSHVENLLQEKSCF